MLPLLLALTSAPAQAAPWTAGEVQRFDVAVEVVLPRYMWFVANYNEQARVTAFRVRSVLACTPGEPRKRRIEVRCQIEDLALLGAPMPGEVGELQPVLEEMDAKLTGATVVLDTRHDGHIVNVGMDWASGDRRHRRIREMEENLRLVMSRVVAGLDLQRPRGALEVGTVWGQRASLVTMAVSAVGTLGATELAHGVVEVAEGEARLRTTGTAMIAPADPYRDEPVDLFDTVIQGEAALDADGRLLWRKWEATGTPTPSSALAEGTKGLPYIQRGMLRALRGAQPVEVGISEELPPRAESPSALQSDRTSGMPDGVLLPGGPGSVTPRP